MLNLADNELKQELTKVVWNRRGAFRSLEVLDLSGNLFYSEWPPTKRHDWGSGLPEVPNEFAPLQ